MHLATTAFLVGPRISDLYAYMVVVGAQLIVVLVVLVVLVEEKAESPGMQVQVVSPRLLPTVVLAAMAVE